MQSKSVAWLIVACRNPDLNLYCITGNILFRYRAMVAVILRLLFEKRVVLLSNTPSPPHDVVSNPSAGMNIALAVM
jgi:hypothetical protein